MDSLEEGMGLGSSPWDAQLSCASVSFQPYCCLTGVMHVSSIDAVQEALELGPLPLYDDADALIKPWSGGMLSAGRSMRPGGLSKPTSGCSSMPDCNQQ